MGDVVKFTVELDATGEEAEKLYAIFAKTLLSGGFGEPSPLGVCVESGQALVSFNDYGADVYGRLPLADAVSGEMIFDDLKHGADVDDAVLNAETLAAAFEAQAARLRARVDELRPALKEGS
jgi:hypothetical protein